MDRVRFGTEAAGSRSGGASVGRPHRLPIPVDGHPIGAAPWPRFYIELRPIPDNAIGIGAVVDRLNLVRLRGASALLSLNAASLQRNPDNYQRREPGSCES